MFELEPFPAAPDDVYGIGSVSDIRQQYIIGFIMFYIPLIKVFMFAVRCVCIGYCGMCRVCLSIVE